MAQDGWIGHALRRTRLQPQRQAVALAVLGVFIAIILGALYLSQAAASSTLGRQLEELITTRNHLEQDNERLRAEIATYQSVPRLQARAQELGFRLASRAQIEYLVIDGYNPNRSQVITQVETDRPAPIYDESFEGWVMQQLDSFRTQFNTLAVNPEE